MLNLLVFLMHTKQLKMEHTFARCEHQVSSEWLVDQIAHIAFFVYFSFYIGCLAAWHLLRIEFRVRHAVASRPPHLDCTGLLAGRTPLAEAGFPMSFSNSPAIGAVFHFCSWAFAYRRVLHCSATHLALLGGCGCPNHNFALAIRQRQGCVKSCSRTWAKLT